MPTSNILTPLWRFLISLRLTLFLLFILSGACIIGTIVPQKATQAEYIRLFGETGLRLIAACRFDDLFGSWWFQAAMGFFALNLICCTLNRTPRILRALRNTRQMPDPAACASLSCCRTARIESFDAAHEEHFARELRAAFGRPDVRREDDCITLSVQKGRWSRLGFLFTHSALLLIMGGGLLDNLGFKGYMQLYEGEQSDTVFLHDQQGTEQLDFILRCNSFEATFYDNTGRPKSYESSLTIIENGREVLTKQIRVNDPLIYRGIYFYQSSYGSDPSGRGIVELEVSSPAAPEPVRLRIDVGSSVILPGTGDELFIDRFLADFALDERSQPFSRSRELNNPAVLLRCQRTGEPLFTSWLFARFPDFHHLQTDPYLIRITDFIPRQFTGLQVTKDPGVELVWAGCAFLLIGMYSALFCSHRRVWVRCEPDHDGMSITIAGEANKHKTTFKKDFSKLCGRLLSRHAD
jgi:cytochrome c biogenesis protein